MGIPFYGRGRKEVGNFSNYKNIITLTHFERNWMMWQKPPRT